MPKVIVSIPTTDWTELFDSDNAEDRTIYMAGTNLLHILVSNIAIMDFSSITDKEYRTIGGIFSMCDITAGKFVYVKTDTLPNSLFHLPKGQIDPDKDISGIMVAVEAVADSLDTHREDIDDPHEVTKAQVGLGHVPDEATSVVPNTPSGALLLDHVAVQLLSIIAAHVNSTNNPHSTNKEKVGLSDVVNRGISEVADYLDINNNLLATVSAVHTILTSRSESFSSVPPGRIVGGNTEILNNTDKLLYSPESQHVILDGTNLVIKAGLRVSYHDGITSRVSQALGGDINYAHTLISTEVTPRPGWHYLYCNISEVGTIYQIGSKYVRPTYGVIKISTVEGDYIHSTSGIVRNVDGNIVKRVYIAKVYVGGDGLIDYVVNVPQGHVHVQRIALDIFPSTTYTFDNPFFEPIRVTPEIKIGTQWCDPKWNDQIGVIASTPIQELDDIVIQTGALGLATIAPNSGNAFTDTNLVSTFNSSTKLRLIITRL